MLRFQGERLRRELTAIVELGGPEASRIVPMEGLRGLAVFLVFLQHYAYQAMTLGQFEGFGRAVVSALRAYGNIGVELFFVLSGYLIYGTLARRNPPFLGFMQRRIRRIYPTFLVVFAAYLLLHAFAQGDDKIPAEPWAAALYIVANLLLLPGLFPIEPLLSVTWSLSYEMFFYAATAALVSLLHIDRRGRGVRLAVLGAMTLAFLALCFASEAMPVRMMPFFAGMFLAEGVGVTRLRVPSAIGLASPWVALLLAQNMPMGSVVRELMHTLALFGLCGAALAGGAAARVFSWSPARWLGNISYSYYLLHGIAVVSLARVAGSLFGHAIPAWALWLAMPPVFIASLLPALFVFAFVERPYSLAPRRPAAPAVAPQPG